MATLAEILAQKKLQNASAIGVVSSELSPSATPVVEAPPIPAITPTVIPVVKSNPINVEALVQAKEDLLFAEVDAMANADMNNTILKQAAITVEDIVPRIRELITLSDIDAKNEMELLKAALMANPAAVSLMLPSDVGLLVTTLCRVTGQAVLEEKIAKEKKAKKPKALDVSKLSKDQLEESDF
jgi:hypothetical protein